MRYAAKLIHLPLRWRLTLVSFGLLVILLTALGAYVSFTEEQTLFTNQALTLHQEIQLTRGALRNADVAVARPGQTFPTGGALSPKALTGLTFIVGRLTGAGIRAVVLSPSGQVIVTGADSQVAPPPVSISASSLRAALAATPDDSAYDLARGGDGRRQLVILIPLVSITSQTTVAVLQVSTPVTPIEDAIARLRLMLALGVAVTLCIAAALTLPLITAALRPLNVMARTSRRIAEQASRNTNQALAERLDVPPTHDEISRLTSSFNAMVEQLDAAFTRQKRFVADASHELRTPLTALGSGLEMLLLGADQGDPDAARRLSRGMYRETLRLQRLVEDLLALTRLDDNRAPARLQSVAVAPLLADVREQAERLANGHHVRVDVAAGTPPLHADPDWMREVLLILVDNALKHTPPTGDILLSAAVADSADTSTVALSVRDNGAGIPPRTLPHVFERFYRGDTARARPTPSSRDVFAGLSASRGSGAGLGLSIAHQLVQAQGGRISVESAFGVGTTVTVALPLYQGMSDVNGAGSAGLVASSSPFAVTVPDDDAPGIRGDFDDGQRD
jgi:two-component system OmpR family sensor kinase